MPKWARIAKWIAAGFVLLLFTAVLVVFGYANSGAGQARVRKAVLTGLQQSIEGQIAIGRIELLGTTVVLHDVSLRDPSGGDVASIERIDAHVSLLALLSHTVRVTTLEIVRPRLDVVLTPEGTNLTHALHARATTPRTATRRGTSRPFALRIDTLSLRGGELSFRQRLPKVERTFRATGLGGKGSASESPDTKNVTAQLELTAQLTAPLEGPLRLGLETHRENAQQVTRLQVQVAGAELVAQAWLFGPSQRIAVRELRVTPETGRAFVPSWSLQEPLVASGEAQVENEGASVRMAARVGSTNSTVLGKLGLSTEHRFELTLQAHDVDLAQLSRNGPRSKLELTLHANGKAPQITDVDGVVTAEVPEGRINGESAGPFSLRLGARQGTFELTGLNGKLPGLEVDAQGSASSTQVDLAATVHVLDLARLRRAFASLSPALRTPLAGSGTAHIRVQGPLRKPSVRLDADFPRLRRGNNEVDALKLSAQASAGLRGPLAARLQSRRLKLGARSFDQVSASANVSEQSWSGTAQLQGLKLTSRGERLSPNRLRVSALSLDLPHERFTLKAPATISLQRGELSLNPLELTSGRQSIALRGRFGDSLDGAVDVSRLELAGLPFSSFINAPVVAGTLDLHAQVHGPSGQPRVEGELRVAQGRIADLAPLDLGLTAHLEGQRALGRVHLVSRPAALDARFDLPFAALRRGGPERVDARVELHRLSLTQLTQALHLQRPLAGEFHGQLALSGSARDPRLRLLLNGEGLVIAKDAPPLSVALVAHSPRQGGLVARLELGTDEAQGTVNASTGAPLGTLLHSPARALKAPFVVRAHVGALPLESLGLKTRDGRPITGELALSADLTGTPAEPRGHLDGTLKDLKLGALQPLLAELHASASDRGVDARFDAHGPNQPLARARLHVEATPEMLARRGHDLLDVPLQLTAHVGPVQPQDLQWTRGKQLVAQGKLRATVEANLDASGTLRQPVVAFESRLEQMQVKGAPETHGMLTAHYADRHLEGRLALKTVHHGRLDAQLDSQVDLSAPALSHPALADAQTHASLAFVDFRPDFLVDLLPNISDLRGRIDGRARFDGTLERPELAGKVEWSDGVLGVNSMGVFEPVRLIVAFEGHEVRIAPLTVFRGKGRAQLLAVAELGREVKLQGHLDAEQLMITTGFIDRGKLTTAASFDGTFRDAQLSLDVRTERASLFELPRRQPQTVANLGAPFGVRVVNSEDELNAPLVAPPLRDHSSRSSVARRVEPPPRSEQGRFRSPAHPQATSGVRLQVQLHVKDGIAVRSDSLDVHLKVSDPLRVVYQGEPLIFGEVLLDRGKVALLGQHVDAVTGTRVRLAGPLAAGYVEVSAHRVPPTPVTERSLIAGSGTGGSGGVQLHPFGPEMNELQLYRLLATGHLTLSPAGPTGKPPSFVGAFEASLAEQLVASKIPLHLFGIEAGRAPFATASMQTGTWFSDRIFVAYSSELVADPAQGQNATSVALQYDLGPRWQVEFSYGDADQGQANLVWHHRF